MSFSSRPTISRTARSATASSTAAHAGMKEEYPGRASARVTRLRGNVSVREEQATAALEVMSRFALDPRWLVYLSPTTSPCDTSKLAGLLDQPSEVFDYYRNSGVSSVICGEKHMGSRAVVVVGRDAYAG